MRVIFILIISFSLGACGYDPSAKFQEAKDETYPRLLEECWKDADSRLDVGQCYRQKTFEFDKQWILEHPEDGYY